MKNEPTMPATTIMQDIEARKQRNRIIERLRKIHNLTLRGCDGEKETAERMLANALRKYDLQIEDILPDETDIRKTWWYSYNGAFEKRLLRQCFAMVCSPAKSTVYKHKHLRNQLGCALTQAEMVEMDMFYHRYRIMWKEEMDMFFIAFLSKHTIFSEYAEKQKCKNTEDNDLTEEEIEKLRTFMQGMDNANIRRQLCQLES